MSRFLGLPLHIRRKIFTFALGSHHFRIYSFKGQVRPRVCPECYFGLPYAMALGPPVRAIWLLALSYVCRQIYLEVQGLVFAQNKFIGYPVPLAALFKRMASYQANQIRAVTVNVLAAFMVMEGNRTVAGLSDEVIEVLKILCGMRGVQRVSVEWDGKHDNWGEAHDQFQKMVRKTFQGYGRRDVQVRVPLLGMKPQEKTRK